MIEQTPPTNPPENLQRRKVLQGVAAAIAVGTVPSVSAGISSSSADASLSGKLVCNISNPVKTLLLHNHTNQTMVIDSVSKGALMFDGSIVDCNNAFLDKSVSIPANHEVEIRFSKIHARAISHRVQDYQRVQSRVTRLSDGTRVIPFTAALQGNEARFV